MEWDGKCHLSCTDIAQFNHENCEQKKKNEENVEIGTDSSWTKNESN